MASATERQQPTLVDAQIDRTRRSLKLVDLAAGMITLLIGVLVFVLGVAILEHWVVPGGWSVGARILLFAALLLGIGWYSWRTFWPLVRQPINPVYAAQTIEQGSPSLKNSLLNLLLLRNRKRQLSRQVYQAIEQQAAQRLSQVSMDSVVDRSAILRLGYILVAVVALCALYRVLSPKDFMASVTRVLLPWAEVAVPSRVQILDVTPGNTSAARGDQVVLSAEVLGLVEDEQVRVLYSTDDQQIVEQEIFMSATEGGLNYECRLPGGVVHSEGGLQQNLTYWIEAGDARSPHYKVTVFSRPTLIVQRVQYDYPDYTGYPDREETHSGDLHAIEGTVVTLTAIANQSISSAHIDFEADGRLDYKLKAEGQQATISFPLELRDDRRTPRHQSYVLKYTTDAGRKNDLPPKYEIEVTPDYSPEIQLLTPKEESVDVALDGQVAIEVEARDPDFALRNVAVLGEVNGQQILQQILLDKNHTGRFVKQFQLAPSELGLKVGDVIDYWATAADNRQPEANLASTKRRKIRVVGPGEGGGQKEGQQQGEDDQQPGEDGEQGGENQQGEQGEDGEGGGDGGIGQDSEGMAGEDSEQQQGQGGGQNQDSEGQENTEQNSDNAEGGESSADQNNENPSQDNTGEQPGGSDSSEGTENQAQEKVSPDGDEDGEAFDRMTEHFEEQNESAQNGEADEQQEGADPTEDNQQTQNDRGGAEGTPDANQDRAAGSEDTETGESDGQEDAQGQQQDRKAEGKGAEGKKSQGEEETGEEQGEQSQENGSDAGEMSQEQGEAGAGENPGENPGENEGTIGSEEGKKPSDREGDESEGQMQNDQEAPAEGQGQTESNSEGSQGGDKSGGGQQGAGQQADADGTGDAGENQTVDEGGGAAPQPGDGDTTQPGGNQQADNQTGESSQNQSGEGSKQGEKPGEMQTDAKEGSGKESTAGDQPGAKPGDGQPASEDQQSPSDQPSPSNSDSPNANGQQPQGSGTGGNASPPPAGEIQPGDEANLEYAKKQTDLILEKIEDQLRKKEVDKTLLEKLGWSQKELRRFADRWKNLKSQADTEGATEAQQELQEALRSLGLGKNRRTGYRAKTAKDLFRDLQDAPRVRTPLEYQDQLRGYIKGTATAETDE